MQILAEQARDRDLLGKARENPDHEDGAADTRGFERLLESVLAADFDDVIDAAAGPVRSRLAPFGDRAIVDRMVSAQRLCAFEITGLVDGGDIAYSDKSLLQLA